MPLRTYKRMNAESDKGRDKRLEFERLERSMLKAAKYQCAVKLPGICDGHAITLHHRLARSQGWHERPGRHGPRLPAVPPSCASAPGGVCNGRTRSASGRDWSDQRETRGNTMIDAYQRQMRHGLIGGSDAAAACGLDPWRTPYDLWAEKTGRVKGFSGNAATAVGTYLERGLLDYIEDRVSGPMQRDVLVLHGDGLRCVNLDGYMPLAPEPALVEAKTAGIAGRGNPVGWGDVEDGADGIPQHVLIQLHHGFGVVGNDAVDLAHVVACIGGRGICHYRVRRDADLVAAVAERTAAFIERFVRTDTPPEDSAPSLDVARVLTRVPNKTVSLTADVVRRWVDAKGRLADAAGDEEAARAAVFAELGDAEAGSFAGNDAVGGDLRPGTITYFASERAGYTVQPSTVRTLRIKHDKQPARGRRN